jgi:hypothetical protein
MKTHRNDRVIHSYDTEQRRVLCGQTEQSNSTKHSREVTCVSCRELLDHSRASDHHPVGQQRDVTSHP